MIPLVALPSEAISSTNLAGHLVFLISTNERFLQSSFYVHCSPDRSANLRSALDADILELFGAAVVLELGPPEQRPVEQRAVAAAAWLPPAEQVHQRIVVAAAVQADMSSLVHYFVVVVRTVCAALESKWEQEQQLVLLASLAAEVLPEEQGPPGAVVLVEFA